MRRAWRWSLVWLALPWLAACGPTAVKTPQPASASSAAPSFAPTSPLYPTAVPKPMAPLPRHGPDASTITTALGTQTTDQTPAKLCLSLHHEPPLALAWTGLRLTALPKPGVPAARWALWRWEQGRWHLVGVTSTTDSNYLVRVLCAPAPDGSMGIASEWVSGGSDGAGAFRNWMATAQGLQPVNGWLSVISPSLTRIGPDLFREAGARDAYSFLWTKAAGWHLVTLGLQATIPAQAIQIPWGLRNGEPVLLSPPPKEVMADGPVAFVPQGELVHQWWQVVGPFPSEAAAQAVAQAGSSALAMAQFVPGAVVVPPSGTSYWVLAVWPPNHERPTAMTVVKLVAVR
jgi:hypothetical protein